MFLGGVTSLLGPQRPHTQYRVMVCLWGKGHVPDEITLLAKHGAWRLGCTETPSVVAAIIAITQNTEIITALSMEF